MLKRIGTLSVLFFLFLGWLSVPNFLRVQSANLGDATIVMSTPRLSFYGRLHTGNVAGNSIVVLSNHPATDADAASTTSANLFEGDNIWIDGSNYEVASPNSTGSAVFTIDALPSTPAVSALTTANDDAGDDVIASRSASMQVTFDTVSGLADSKIRLLIPRGTTSNVVANTASNDSIPDRDGWDLTAAPSTNLQVTCTVDDGDGGTDHVTGQTTSLTANLVLGSSTYHSAVCDFTGEPVIAAGSTIVMTISSTTAGTNAGYAGPINPAPSTSHSLGFADNYNFVIQHLTPSDTVLDSSTMAAAVIESVLVTASVPPQITFKLLGVSSSNATYCGITTSVTTTPVLVPFGDLIIDAYRYAAQELVVSTNAPNGYVVTGRADNQLHRTDEACAGDATTGGCIPDSTGDNGTMSHTTKTEWTVPTNYGFGYTLQAKNAGPTMAFTHADGDGTCDGNNGNCWKQFSDAEAGQAVETLFSYTAPASNHSGMVCYKASISPTQEAGNDYTTGVTYRATATF